MKLTFWGAARTVTGSMHHFETGGQRYLLDCGLYQGKRQEAFERQFGIARAPSFTQSFNIAPPQCVSTSAPHSWSLTCPLRG